ncbi:hypothetical protein BZA77DRAFT_360556 [Pyronema omphalodes]|nr:hypothetical protein BZA77DRAFT_360556 [Pyronema omphalodes]
MSPLNENPTVYHGEISPTNRILSSQAQRVRELERTQRHQSTALHIFHPAICFAEDSIKMESTGSSISDYVPSPMTQSVFLNTELLYDPIYESIENTFKCFKRQCKAYITLYNARPPRNTFGEQPASVRAREQQKFYTVRGVHDQLRRYFPSLDFIKQDLYNFLTDRRTVIKDGTITFNDDTNNDDSAYLFSLVQSCSDIVDDGEDIFERFQASLIELNREQICEDKYSVVIRMYIKHNKDAIIERMIKEGFAESEKKALTYFQEVRLGSASGNGNGNGNGNGIGTNKNTPHLETENQNQPQTQTQTPIIKDFTYLLQLVGEEEVFHNAINKKPLECHLGAWDIYNTIKPPPIDPTHVEIFRKVFQQKASTVMRISAPSGSSWSWKDTEAIFDQEYFLNSLTFANLYEKVLKEARVELKADIIKFCGRFRHDIKKYQERILELDKDKELSKTLSTADKLLRNPIESSQQKDSKKQRLKYIESLKECQQFLKIAETLRTGTKAWPSETGKLIRDYRSDTARNLVLRSRALYQLLPTVDFAGDAANDSWSVGESIFGKTWRKKLQGWAEDLGARSRCDFCRTHGGCELCLWMGKVTKPE